VLIQHEFWTELLVSKQQHNRKQSQANCQGERHFLLIV